MTPDLSTLEEGLLILIVTAVDRCPASLSVQGSGSHTEENRPTLHKILPLLRAERFTERFTSKYTITCLGNGQRMRTNIVAIATRPSFFIDGLGTRLPKEEN